MLKYLICIPTYNEAETIESIINRFNQLLFTNYTVDILVVDDNSPDGTADIVDNLSSRLPLYVLKREKKEGLGPAYLAGFTWGLERDYDYFVECDADGSHQPEEFCILVEKSYENDLVLGTRWMMGGKVVNWPLIRRVISRAGTFYAQKVLNLPYKDLTGGYRIYSRKALLSIPFNTIATHGYGFQIEMAMRIHDNKMKIAEVPITFIERREGTSKMSKRIVLEALAQTTIWGFKRRLR
jgi:dolichol-phosphate mannosyltransferase